MVSSLVYLVTVSPSSSIIIKTARNDIYSRSTWINPGGKLGIKARLVTTLHDYIVPGKRKQRPFISKLLNWEEDGIGEMVLRKYLSPLLSKYSKIRLYRYSKNFLRNNGRRDFESRRVRLLFPQIKNGNLIIVLIIFRV